MRVRSRITKESSGVTPQLQQFNESLTVETPIGQVNLNQSSTGTTGTIRTPLGTFDVWNTNVNQTSNSSTTNLSDNTDMSAPQLSYAKVTLRAINPATPIDDLIFDFNPEDLNVAHASEIGEYQGLSHIPQVYYSGLKADRMNIKWICSRRDTGIKEVFNSLKQFALPNGRIHLSSDKRFAAPPLCHLIYGRTGTFIGYVENPQMQIALWNQDLMPVQGYLSFTFIAIDELTTAASMPISGGGVGAATIVSGGPSGLAS